MCGDSSTGKAVLLGPWISRAPMRKVRKRKLSETEGATASTSAAAPKPVIPRSAKVIRVDVCPIDEAARMYPVDEKSYSSTSFPKHLIAEREAKTSGSSGASMYTCVHPKCDPPFIAKGGTTSLFTHVRRHHLGVCLVCLILSPQTVLFCYWLA